MTANFKLDMTMMYAFHDALRRDLVQVTHMTAPSGGLGPVRAVPACAPRGGGRRAVARVARGADRPERRPVTPR